MKLRDFYPLTVRDTARYIANHLPSGRAWDKRERNSNLWRLILTVAHGLHELIQYIWQFFTDWRIDSASDDMIARWERSFDLPADTSKSISSRRAAVKASVRRQVVVSVAEWTETLRDATGNSSIEVYAGSDYTGGMVLPNPVPTPLFFIEDTHVRRFAVYVANTASDDERHIVHEIADRYKPANVVIIFV